MSNNYRCVFWCFFLMFLFEIDGVLKNLLVYEKVGDLV